MGTIHSKILGVRPAANGLALAVAALLLPAMPGRAQLPAGFGRATDFSSVEYYEAPFDQQIKTRLAGAESSPVPGSPGVLDVRMLRIENFGTNGALEIVITAPQCFYSTMDYTAHSAGPILVQTGDGQSTHSGIGFLWRQSDAGQTLSISNQVKTVISGANIPAPKKPAAATPTKP